MAGFGIPISQFRVEALNAIRQAGGVPSATPNSQAGFFGTVSSGVGGLLDTVGEGLSGILGAVGPNAQAFAPLLAAVQGPKLLTEQRRLEEARAAQSAIDLKLRQLTPGIASVAAPPAAAGLGIDPKLLLILAGVLVVVVALK